jgi:hypothetical protein
MAEKLQKMQQELQAMLRKAKEGKLTENQLAELKNRIAAMKRMMERLSRQMARTARRIEREFLNPDAMRTAGEGQDFHQSLDRLQKMAESGQLQDAISEAEALNQRLGQMMNALGKSGQRLAQSRLGQQMQQLKQLQQGLQDIRKRETSLERQTRDLHESILGAARKEHGDTLDQFFEKQKARVEQIQQDLQKLSSRLREEPNLEEYRKLREELHQTLRRLPTERGQIRAEDNGHSAEAVQQKLEKLYRQVSSMSRAAAAHKVMEDAPETGNRSAELKRALQDEEVEAALRRASSLAPRLRNWTGTLRQGELPDSTVARAAGAATNAERIRKDLSELSETLQRSAEQKARGSMGGPAQQTAQKQRNTAEGLEKLMQNVGNAAGEELRRTLDGAKTDMDSAAKRLSQRQLGPANEDQKNALKRLDRAIAESDEAMKRMKQNMRGRAARPGDSRRRQAGRYGRNSDRVRIPDPSTYEVPAQFREAIEEALREGLPDSYRESNEDYYEELVK